MSVTSQAVCAPTVTASILQTPLIIKGTGLAAVALDVSPSNTLGPPKLQFARSKVASGIASVAAAQLSRYSHGSPLPSTFMSPKRSSTVPLQNNSIASSPLIDIAPLTKSGAKPKNVVNPVVSEAIVKQSPAEAEMAGKVNSSPSVPPPLLADPIP